MPLILRMASLPKYIPVVVYSGSSSFTITGLIKFYIFFVTISSYGLFAYIF